MDQLINEYESKCKNIISIYPKMKVYISLIMPTKSQLLNILANEFNAHLIQMASKYSNISVIKHSSLVDKYGFLDESLGRFEHRRPSNDIVHLGPEGYKKFVNNIKECIMSKKNPRQNIVPYKQQDKPSIRGPPPRSTQPEPGPPGLHPSSFPTLPNLHPSRPGFGPFATLSQSLPPTPDLLMVTIMELY
jgi:hypothetical protein